MKEAKIFDVFLFFNELDLLELRLETLYEVVDYFVITELFETFSGKSKSSLFEKEKKRYEKYSEKIIYNFVCRDKLEDLKKDKFLDYLSDFNGIVSYQNNGKSYKQLHKTLKPRTL